jgi:hypothetical protein
VTALRAISSLLCGCVTADSVEPSELCFLLEPIVEREMSVVEEVRRLFGRSREKKPNCRLTCPARPGNHQT